MIISTRGLQALARIEDAWRYIPDAVEPPLTRAARPARPARPMTGEQLLALDELLVAERSERAALAARGYTPLRPGRAPVNLAPLDAADVALAAVETAAWQAKAELRHEDARMPVLGVTHPTPTARLLAGVDVLVAALPRLEPPFARQIVPPLARAAGQLVDAVGAGDEWTPVPADCAACRSRSLEALIGPDERLDVVRCTECECAGPTCPCEDPGDEGDEHVWPLRLLYERRPWPIKADRRLARRLTEHRRRYAS